VGGEAALWTRGEGNTLRAAARLFLKLYDTCHAPRRRHKVHSPVPIRFCCPTPFTCRCSLVDATSFAHVDRESRSSCREVNERRQRDER
jgi:hypothetical protein